MFWNYTKLTFKSVILYITFFLDLVGMVLTYYKRLEIPEWIFFALPAIAFYLTGYLIYKNSSPSITVNLPDKDDVKISKSQFSYTVLMKTSITNYGLKPGSLEDIKVNFIGINEIVDEFLLSNLNISVDPPEIFKEEPNIHLLELMRRDYEFKLPLIILPDTFQHLYIYTNLYIYSSDDKELNKAFEWLKQIDFELKYKYKDSFGSHHRTSKFNIQIDGDHLKKITKKYETAINDLFSNKK
jgi:hypothetical protein